MVWPVRVDSQRLRLSYYGGFGLIAAISGNRMTSLAMPPSIKEKRKTG